MNNILGKESTYVFVAVRMKSSRLPLKAMLDVYGKPLLLRLIERIAETVPLDKIVICTSIHSQDNDIEHFAIQHKFNYFRGDEMDVMGRFINAAKKFNAKTIVRVTGDSPLIYEFSIIALQKCANSSGFPILPIGVFLFKVSLTLSDIK